MNLSIKDLLNKFLEKFIFSTKKTLVNLTTKQRKKLIQVL